MTIEVWSWPTPNGHKIHIALEELELPYRVVPVNIGKGEQFHPEFLAITPNHRIPAIAARPGVQRGVAVLSGNQRSGPMGEAGRERLFGRTQFQAR